MKPIHPILMIPFSELEVSIAFREMCSANEFHTLSDILRFPVHVLMKKHDLTPHMFIELMDILKQYEIEDLLKEEFG